MIQLAVEFLFVILFQEIVIAEGRYLSLYGEAIRQVVDVFPIKKPAPEIHGSKGAGINLAAAAEDVIGAVVHGVALDDAVVFGRDSEKFFARKSQIANPRRGCAGLDS